jgi:phosphoglycolate phosphatase
MSSLVSCVVYDLDGTLVDTVANITAAVNRERKKRCLSPMSVAQVSPCIGQGSRVLIERALFGQMPEDVEMDWTVLEKRGGFEAVYQSFMAGYIADPLDGARVYDGVQEALDYFRDANITQLVLTNKPHHVANALLKALELDAYFELILGPDGEFQGVAVAPKPDPSTLNAIIDWLGVERSGVWVVGDGVPDVRVAQAAGVRSLAVQGGFYPVDLLPGLDPPPEVMRSSFRLGFEYLRELYEKGATHASI